MLPGFLSPFLLSSFKLSLQLIIYAYVFFRFSASGRFERPTSPLHPMLSLFLESTVSILKSNIICLAPLLVLFPYILSSMTVLSREIPLSTSYPLLCLSLNVCLKDLYSPIFFITTSFVMCSLQHTYRCELRRKSFSCLQ